MSVHAARLIAARHPPPPPLGRGAGRFACVGAAPADLNVEDAPQVTAVL
jgi:hypothetical protein